MITALTLTDFRSYSQAQLTIDHGLVVLHGANGAGKTNVLEAISLLTPGRGLRGASASDMGRRDPGQEKGRAWAVTALLAQSDGDVRLGTGIQTAQSPRRIVRVEGETVQPGGLLDYLRPVWATPDHDRLFSDARTQRLKFFDRLVFAALPDHAAQVTAYEKALRERLRLLTNGRDGRSGADPEPDPLWLDALEARLAETGAAAARARVQTLVALQAAIDEREGRPFPQADLDLVGPTERAILAGTDSESIKDDLRAGFRTSRARDASAGRSLFGPHRTDLTALHRQKNRPAAEGSSGEQKALALNLILAQLSCLGDQGVPPLLLLDEVPAHLDSARRAGLFEEIRVLGLQAFMTGTEDGLFDALSGQAQFVRVQDGRLIHD